MLIVHRVVVLALAVAACEMPGPLRVPVFVDGRAVAPAGDSVFGVAAAGGPLLRLRASGLTDSLGSGVLQDPVTVQFVAGYWWTSDLQDGRATIVRFGDGEPLRYLPDVDAVQPHQFAILPDGGLVYETPDRRLVVRRGDSTVTFAVVQPGDRPSLMVGASGGALHAVPGKHVTLYNAFGNVRWRLNWPWVETAHISAIAVDPQGRIQVLSGVADEGTFIVYTVEPTSGEVTRWSVPDSGATFVVDRFGEVTADTRGRWRR